MKYLRALYGVVLVGVIIAAAVGVLKRQAIQDWWALRDYTPPIAIAKLADDTTMTTDTRRVFYVNHPKLDEKVTFNGDCRTTEQSIVIGCYVENSGIYLLNVTEPRLNGVIEVTAAHEALHAEYHRLSTKERAKVDAMTSSYFKTLKDDDRIVQTIALYQAKDPKVVPNELHSILGTEVENLPADLEAYYAQYFQDRKQIAKYSDQYEQAFVDLKNQVDQYDARLEQYKTAIDSSRAAITSQNAQLESARSELDAKHSSGDFDSYNAAVPGFNKKVNDFNSQVEKFRDLIASYNSLVEKRNAVAVQEQELTQSLNSNFTTEKQK